MASRLAADAAPEPDQPFEDLIEGRLVGAGDPHRDEGRLFVGPPDPEFQHLEGGVPLDDGVENDVQELRIDQMPFGFDHFRQPFARCHGRIIASFPSDPSSTARRLEAARGRLCERRHHGGPTHRAPDKVDFRRPGYVILGTCFEPAGRAHVVAVQGPLCPPRDRSRAVNTDVRQPRNYTRKIESPGAHPGLFVFGPSIVRVKSSPHVHDR